MCSNGHSCCEHCKEKKNSCGYCSSKLEYKNAAVMDLIENFRFSCELCEMTFFMQDFLDHLKEEWTCYLCDQRFCESIEGSVNHLVDDHKAKFITLKKEKGTINVTSRDSVFYCYYNQGLFVFIHKKNSKYVSVFTTGSELIPLKYTIGGITSYTNISSHKLKNLSSSKQLESNYVLEFEIDKINT